MSEMTKNQLLKNNKLEGGKSETKGSNLFKFLTGEQRSCRRNNVRSELWPRGFQRSYFPEMKETFQPHAKRPR